MKNSALLTILLVAFFCSFSAQAQSENSLFENPLFASMLAAANHPQSSGTVLQITWHPEREADPLLHGKTKVDLALYKASKAAAPLVFVIPGVGGDASSGTALALAEIYARWGFHAVVVPNSLSWTYIAGISDSGVAGYMPDDTPEYYHFLKSVAQKLVREQHLQITGYSVIGYSMGALQAVFLAQYDRQQNDLRFAKIIAINPPVDVDYGVTTLDRFYSAGDRVSETRKQWLLGEINNVGADFINGHISLQEVTQKIQQWHVSQEDAEWIIGESYRLSLRDVIFVSQEIQDLGILKNQATVWQRNARYNEAGSYDFHQYYAQFVLPALLRRKVVTTDQNALGLGGLMNMTEELTTDLRLYVMDNQDDFLLRSGDASFLQAQLGTRLTMYPHGGHVGNATAPANLARMKQILLSN